MRYIKYNDQGEITAVGVCQPCNWKEDMLQVEVDVHPDTHKVVEGVVVKREAREATKRIKEKEDKVQVLRSRAYNDKIALIDKAKTLDDIKEILKTIIKV